MQTAELERRLLTVERRLGNEPADNPNAQGERGPDGSLAGPESSLLVEGNREGMQATQFSDEPDLDTDIASFDAEVSDPAPVWVPHTLAELLSEAVALELTEVWFRKYHRWFPILHQPSFLALLQSVGGSNITGGYGLLLQAMAAITIQHWETLRLDREECRLWQERLTESVINKALECASLQALQALLVVSVLYYGNGRFLQAANLVALCRR